MATYKGYTRTGIDPNYLLGDTVTVVASEDDLKDDPSLEEVVGAVGVVRDRWTNSMFSIFTQHIYVVEFTRGRPNTPEELFGPEETSALLMFNERLLSV